MTDKSTIGRLYINGVFECFTLEDRDRRLEEGNEKIPGESAIPRGTYPILVTFSNRFKEELPILKGVPAYEGVRIHPGNRSCDTEGCILPGSGIGSDVVFNSRAAFAKLFNKIDNALTGGEEVSITIK